MKVVKNYLYNASYQVLAIIVPLITSYYVSRVLDPAGVGANAFTNSVIQYFVLLADLGIAYYGNREIAYVRDDKKKMAQTFWEIQTVKTSMTLISYVVFVIFMNFYVGKPQYMWAQSINLVAAAFDISWLYQGLEDFKRTVLRNTFVKILSMVAVFIFIKDSSDVTLYIVIVALSNFLGNFTLWPHALGMLKKVPLKKLRPWRHLPPAVSMFVPQIAIQLYVQLNRTMLGIMVNEKASGFYQYSDNLIKLVLAFATATGTVMLPHVANAFAQGDMKKVNRMLYKSFDFVSALVYPMMFGICRRLHDASATLLQSGLRSSWPCHVHRVDCHLDDWLVQCDWYPVPFASQPCEGLYSFCNLRGSCQYYLELPSDPFWWPQWCYVVHGNFRNFSYRLPALGSAPRPRPQAPL